MARNRTRLLAFVSLVAFLAANTHASAVLVHLTARPARHTTTVPPTTEDVSPAAEFGRTSCCHCRKSRPAVTERTAATTAARAVDESGPCGPDCPDCPKGPTCPCPGGCAACNVAKVPCCLPAVCFGISVTCLGDSLEETPPFYTPPTAGRLARPPRV